jgi:hypothetical protein
MRWALRSLLTLASLIPLHGCGSEASGTGAIIDACPEIPNPEPLDCEGCTITAGDRPSCLVLRHAVIECDSFWSFPGGIRVAVDERGAMLSANDGYVPRLVYAGADGYAIELLPPEFVRAFTLVSQDLQGTLGFALSENEAEPASLGMREGVALRLATRSGEGWAFELLPTQDTLNLLAFELDAAGAPRVWTTPSSSWAPQRLTRTAADEWSVEPITASGHSPQFGLGADETELIYGYRELDACVWQLGVEFSGGEASFGPAVQHRRHYVPLPPARPSSTDPRALALALLGDHESRSLRLLGSDCFEVVIPGTQPLLPSCAPPPGSCPKSCHETGEGVVEQGFAGARASDGSVWVGWVRRQLDHGVIYGQECDEPGDPSACACVVTDEVEDQSRDTLHLARVADGQVDELLTLEIPRLASRPTAIGEVTRSIDMRAFGDRLALGLQSDVEPRQLRLLEIDIGGL